MGKRTQKRRHLSHLAPSQSNLKLEDSANAKTIPHRLSKGHLKNVYKPVEPLPDLSDSEFENDKVEDVAISNLKDHKIQGFSSKPATYPIDLWFILSEYIPPELIGKFALICKSAHYVTTTVSFYKRLWLRYDPVLMPGRCTEWHNKLSANVNRYIYKEKGRRLKSNVIRGLYYCYPPFQLKAGLNSREHLEMLCGSRCLMQWHSVVDAGYLKCHRFNFKFKTCDHPNGAKKHGKSTFWINEEESCCVLQVTCREFMDFSRTQVYGFILTKTYLTLSTDLNQKLKLVFHKHLLKPQSLKNYKENLGEVVNMFCVLSHRVIHWWEPTYPFNNIKQVANVH